MRRLGLARVAIATVGACSLTVGVIGLQPASAEGGCPSTYQTFTALASAAGARTTQYAPGASLVPGADGNLPAAQAVVDSVSRSVGWAGAPYSSTVADNAGLSGSFGLDLTANDIPVFVFSSDGAPPKSSKSAGAATIEATSASNFGPATAKVVGGIADSEQVRSGRSNSSAVASCGDDGKVESIADNDVDAFNAAGVFGIGSVSSHARAVYVDGQRTLEGTMEVEGATILGQAVAITDRGLVIGTSANPAPDNPLLKALTDAGITVKYIAAAKDDQTGEVFAPGLEVTITRRIEGVGSGPVTSSYILGRAYARSDASGEGSSIDLDTPAVLGGVSAPSLSEPPASGGGAIVTPAGSGPAPAATPSSDQSGIALPTARIADWSIAPAYSAMGVGALLLVIAWIGLEKIAVRFRWS